MKTTVELNIHPAYTPFEIQKALYEFEVKLENVMYWAHFCSLDDDLATATDDYVRLDFAATDDKDEDDETAEVYGVTARAHYVDVAQIFATIDILEHYGYRVAFDESSIVEEPDADLIPCYWEE